MHKLKYTALLYSVIFIEAYVVLSSEILALRQVTPFIGTGTDIVSVILAAFLISLAIGYQSGGEFKPYKICGILITTRKKLILNVLIASTILTAGLSYRLLFSFFHMFFFMLDLHDRIFLAAIYGALFLVIPIYLLGQTVPLITRFFKNDNTSEITGRILFISTLGSVAGAILTSLCFMSVFGAHHTVTFNFLLLCILTILLSKKKDSPAVILMMILFLFNICINSNYALTALSLVKNNRYGVIAVMYQNGYNMLSINHNHDSKYNPETKRKHSYIEFAERVAVVPMMNGNDPPREVLVIGAGGFTFGHEDMKNNYTFVDIDSDLLGIAERFILQEPLGKNKHFVPEEARAYLRFSGKKFDLIYLDAYLGGLSIPEQLVTQDFYIQVRNALNDKGVLIINMIVSPNFSNVFTRSLDNTLVSVFPNLSRHAINESFVVWNDFPNIAGNVAYIYKKNEGDLIREILSSSSEPQQKNKIQ